METPNGGLKTFKFGAQRRCLNWKYKYLRHLHITEPRERARSERKEPKIKLGGRTKQNKTGQVRMKLKRGVMESHQRWRRKTMNVLFPKVK